MTYRIEGIPTAIARALQSGGPDAYGNPPERRVSEGGGVPCRHCLEPVADRDAYLVLAYRPFASLQAYAETGPIFLHQRRCQRGVLHSGLPEILSSPDYIVRGYNDGEQIIYGTGGVVATGLIASRVEELFGDERVRFIHVRSSRNNCFQCRIDR